MVQYLFVFTFQNLCHGWAVNTLFKILSVFRFQDLFYVWDVNTRFRICLCPRFKTCFMVELLTHDMVFLIHRKAGLSRTCLKKT